MPYVAARFVPVPESQLDRGPIRGWCPGVLDPMETGDGWLLRVRLPGGALTADDLRLVAGVASELGSGFVEITSRANLQISCGYRPVSAAPTRSPSLRSAAELRVPDAVQRANAAPQSRDPFSIIAR